MVGSFLTALSLDCDFRQTTEFASLLKDNRVFVVALNGRLCPSRKQVHKDREGMNILLSNDDGYLAPGLLALATVVAEFGTVTVIAPDRNRSGTSHALTLTVPLRVQQAENGFFFVNGTPADCVHIGLTGILQQEPDMVIAGINDGANLGDDVLYSGTVAAAMEGRFLGSPAIAVSLVGNGHRYFETAIDAVRELLELIHREPLPPDTILNVNVPNLPRHEVQGFQATRLGTRHKSEPVIKGIDPTDKEIFWLGPAGAEDDNGPGTDFFAVANGYISLTPLRVDLTEHNAVRDIGIWLGGNA
ncbi:5'/3'-nucleotidase SurE [uncultured Mediterranean phage]|nr:5'/3'-nucleotidase SurE [uncultured Mediterranean phage]